MVCIMFIIFVLFLGSIFFSVTEDWTVGAALYFCFVSLTTIGYGDLVPLSTFVNASDGFWPVLKVVISIGYIVGGSSL